MRPDPELVPIDEASRRLRLRASAIRYYEQRGLIEASSRRGGKRWYDADQMRRLAVIRFWQESGLMSLDQITEVLAGPDAVDRWSKTVKDQIHILGEQIDRMRTARDFLAHVLEHHRDTTPDGCPHYESVIWESLET